MKKLIKNFTIPLIFGIIVFGGLVPSSFSSDHNLFVSIDGVETRHLKGDQVVEVKIMDSDISDTTEAKGEPDVTVNGKILRMVQAEDSNWYGYFADVDTAQLSDSIADIPGNGLDFGTFCGSDSTILNGDSVVSLGNTEGIAINSSDGIDGTNPPTTIIPNCNVTISPDNSMEVLEQVEQINTNSPPGTIAGQIGMDTDAWPFIQLYSFTDGGSVIVNLNKGGFVQTFSLKFFEDNPSIRSIIFDSFLKKGDRTGNRCLYSDFIDIHVRGNSVYNIPDLGDDTIKIPGGTNLIKVQYNSEMSEVESMEFYKGEKHLGTHTEFSGQTDVNVLGGAQGWACENDSGDFPKGTAEVWIMMGSTPIEILTSQKNNS